MSLPPSCWTCRLRRKKCDRTKPACHACQALEITCHYGEARPEWMDGAEKQAEMARIIKAEVRQGAEARRERQYVQVLTLHEDLNPPRQRPGRHERPSLSSLNNSSTDQEHDQDMDDSGPDFMSITPKSSPPASTGTSDEPICPDCVAEGFGSPPFPKDHAFTIWNLVGIDSEHDLEGAHDVETDFIMTYLDHVFPLLHPFYQPSVWKAGRSWLLALLRNNTALFHSGMSLSAYFLHLILKGGERHKVCSQKIWNNLVAHVDTAVRAMQHDMGGLKAEGDSGAITVYQMARVMESIMQLFILEHTMARTADWNGHLTAAMAVFDEIFEKYGTNNGQPDISTLLASMDKLSWGKGPGLIERTVFNTDQGAFRFYAAHLLYTDIVASTALESPLRLKKYHHLIVQDNAPGQSDELFRMEDFVGCQGWALIIVGQIAELGAWKKESKAKGVFCRHEVIEGGSQLHKKLQDGLAYLERESFKKRPFDITHVLRSYYRPDAAHQMRTEELISVTRVWALAAMAYLSVVVTGWQATTRTTTSSIALAMQLLYSMSSPAVLRSLAWPFLVLGCLATREQEQMFVHMASSMGPLLEFGTIGEAMRIMKRVWELRDEGRLDGDWDMASCFKVLGSRALLT